MPTAAPQSHPRMTVADFLDWSEEQLDDARYELVAGVPLQLMAPTSIRHARIQRNVSGALRAAVATSGRPCEVFDAGPGLAIGLGGDECGIPDVVVTCKTEIDETARLVPEPVIVVEVASPSTRLADVNDKAEFYGISLIQHYLVIEQAGAGPSIMDAARAEAWSLGSCGMARSSSTRPASGSRSTRSTGTPRSPSRDAGDQVRRRRRPARIARARSRA